MSQLMDETTFKKLEQIKLDGQRDVDHNVKKFCYFCLRKFNKRVQMEIQLEENWHMCPDCKGVQPITSSIPLFWVNCPKYENGNTCNYPQLIIPEQKGTRTTCHKCGTEYDIK